MATRKKRRLHPLHTFILRVDHHDGRGEQEVPLICTVKLAKKGVRLVMKTEDVVLSNKLHGVGNSMLCAMAQCSKRLSYDFPHPHLGVIDWLLKTCFVLTKMPVGKRLGECVKYEHVDNIAHLFDKPGQVELLNRLEANGGELVVNLRPARDRRGESHYGGNAPSTGIRTTPTSIGHASKRRFAIAMAQRLQLPAQAPTKAGGYMTPQGRPRSIPPD